MCGLGLRAFRLRRRYSRILSILSAPRIAFVRRSMQHRLECADRTSLDDRDCGTHRYDFAVRDHNRNSKGEGTDGEPSPGADDHFLGASRACFGTRDVREGQGAAVFSKASNDPICLSPKL